MQDHIDLYYKPILNLLCLFSVIQEFLESQI